MKITHRAWAEYSILFLLIGLLLAACPSNKAPTADFSANATSGVAPLTVQFTDASSAGSSSIASWAWSFGDGGISAEQSPSHEYKSGGTFTVELTVTSDDGSDTETKTGFITVTKSPDSNPIPTKQAPTAAFGANTTGGAAPLTVQFTDSSTAGSSPIASWAWSFGDGRTSTEQSPSHEYTYGGTFTVALTVTSADGSDTESKTAFITVTETWDPDSFTFDVQTVPGTVMIDQDHLSLLVDSDTENHVYTINTEGEQAAGLDLTAGKLLVIHGVDVRRITTVTPNGNNLVLETEFVPLNEVITEGTIAWDYGVEFTPAKIRSVEVPGKGIIFTKAATPIEFDLDIGEYNYAIKATLDTEFTTVEFTITKGLLGSAEAKLVAIGDIRRFRSKDTITFAGGQLREFGHELNGMRGELTMELIVLASGNDFINLELPATIMKIPFLVGFIPVELNVKVQFVINASVPVDGSSHVKTKFNYDSDLGFSCDGVNVSAQGRLGAIEFGKDINQTGASGAIGANFGMGFPRVELSILHDSVVPWAQTAFLIGGSYTFTPPCQTADAEFIGAAGYDLGLFGLNLLSGRKTFFDEKKELLRAGNCSKDAIADAMLDASGLLVE